MYIYITIPLLRHFSSFFFSLVDTDFLFLFLRDADSRKGATCPFCVPIHKKKKKKKTRAAHINQHYLMEKKLHPKF